MVNEKEAVCVCEEPPLLSVHPCMPLESSVLHTGYVYRERERERKRERLCLYREKE